MNLQSTQQLFTNAILNRDDRDTDRFHALLASNPSISAGTAIEIYRNNYQGALINTLELVYPVCKKIVGEQCFRGLATRYIQLYPSTNPDLNQYGGMFAEYLEHHVLKQPAFADLPYLADLARMEQYIHKVYYADDDAEFDFDFLSRISGSKADGLYFILSNSLEMMSSEYPVYEIWKLNRNNGDTREVKAIETPDYYLIYRDEYVPVINKTDRHTWTLLQSIKKGISLKDLSSMNNKYPELQIESLLPEVIKNKWVTGCYYDSAR